MKAAIVKEDGLIYVNEVPEEPEYNGEIGHSINVQKQYYGQLEVAKTNAILVSDQKEAKRFVWYNQTGGYVNIHDFVLKPGIYPIPDLQWGVKQYSCNHTLKPNELPCPESANEFPDCCGSKQQVAILKESTPSRGDAHKRFLDSRRRFFEGNWNKESTPLTEEGTLEDYLKRNKDKHEFRLVIHEDGRGYIHALGQDSETLDFQL